MPTSVGSMKKERKNIFYIVAYRFLRRQIRWSGIPISLKNFPQLLVICTVKGFSIVIEAVDVVLEFRSRSNS